MRPLLLAAALLALTFAACEPASSPSESRELPAPPVADTPAVDPHLRAPPADPTLGVLVGELSSDFGQGLLVLAFDLSATLERDCGEYQHQFSGRWFRCEAVPLGLYTAFVRGNATRWSRIPVYVKPGEITDLGTIELEPLPPAAVIRGVIRDPSGQPLEDVEVSYPISWCGAVHMVWRLDWTTSTTSAGEFVLHPEDRQIWIDTHKEGYESAGGAAEFGGVAAEWGDVLDLVLNRRE